MAITYKSGRRIQGTSTDFGTAGSGIPAVSGGWKEVGRTTLGTSGSTIDVTSIPDKRYYMVLRSILTAGADVREQFNSDTGTNYARRYSANGGTDVASANDARIGLNYSAGDKLLVNYISNLSSKEKLVLSFSSEEGIAGSGNAPNRMEVAGKWANTSDPISKISTSLSGSSYDIGSEVVVLGWDEDDSHTTNFWEELYTDTKTSDNQEFSTGTIAAKKYLWLQFYQQGHTGNSYLNFNADSGSNYARRHSINGASDASVTSQTTLNNVLTGGTADHHTFTNMFIINNSANEKLCIFNTTFNASGSTGAGNAPQRIEGVTKWSNTSAQITSLTVTDNGGAGFDIGSTLKIWGSN